MSRTYNMSAAIVAATTEIINKAVDDATELLSAKYGFDAAAAKEFLKNGEVEIKVQTLEKSTMPWCGVVDGACCDALTYSGGLYTQCPKKKAEGSTWCKKCAKQVEKDGTPSQGDVHARLSCDVMEYQVGKRKVVPFSVHMAKNGISREEVDRLAAEIGVTIDPRNFAEKKRGRPAKKPNAMTVATPADEASVEAAATDESASESEEEVEVVETAPIVAPVATEQLIQRAMSLATTASVASVSPAPVVETTASVASVSPAPVVETTASVATPEVELVEEAPKVAPKPEAAAEDGEVSEEEDEEEEDEEEVEDNEVITYDKLIDMSKVEIFAIAAKQSISTEGLTPAKVRKAIMKKLGITPPPTA